MIPNSPSPTSMRRYVRNVTDAYDRTTEDHRARGRAWYLTANQLASMLADGDTRKGAGVIAALSANKRWTENQKLASRAFSGNVSGHTGVMLLKATRILAGEDPVNVLPMHAKTGHFFRCILDPTDPDAVCVDRHAHDVAVGRTYGDDNRGLGSKGRYAALVDVYRTAARRLDILPQHLQAIVWVAHVETGKETVS